MTLSILYDQQITGGPMGSGVDLYQPVQSGKGSTVLI